MPPEAKKSAEGIRLDILRGWSFHAELERPNVVRIFLSSTFHDFVHERNYLFQEIFPNITKWCQEKGLEFQVSDMRWGIRDTGDSDHDGMSMCLKEVQHCQELSIGPNFVAFIGDRYGNRPIPGSVTESEFLVLLKHTANKIESDLLKSCYQLDSNNLPPVYLRKNASQMLEDYNNLDTNKLRDNTDSQWVSMQAQVRDIIYAAAKKAVEDNDLEFAYRFVSSVTEQEIWNGILTRDNPERCALCFNRNLKRIKIDPSNKLTRKYVDLKSYDSSEVDPTASQMLEELKTFLIPKKLDERSVFHYELSFDATSGINPEVAEHRTYLKEMGETFQTKIIDLIVDGLKTVQQVSIQDPLYKEVVQHAAFGNKKAQLYCGQEKVLNRIFNRFMDKKTTQPLILYGESGVGKTATVAKIIQETWKHVQGPPNVVYRFLGTTPSSSSIDLLFLSLSQHICDLYGLRLPNNKEDDFNQIRPYFFDLIQQVGNLTADNKQLIIILDSLDQLSPAYGAHLMNWLPDKLPSRVKLLLTVMPHYQNILTRLQARLKPSNFIELTQISNETATDVLAKLLDQSSRTLQPDQLKLVETVFKEAQTPLLLHMTVLEAQQWKSFTPTDQLKLGSSIREAIHILFERLEKNHGKVLVSHALSNIVVAKNGLTEIEMEEILSLDNEVLDDVYQYWAPPSDSEIRIPPLLFARFKQEMKDFIMSRRGDEMTVMGIYHKQFTEVILQRYLSSPAVREKIHENLAQYFLGEWHDKPKPAPLNVFNGQTLTLLRRVSKQPLKFGDNARSRYNLRKLNELPHHLTKSHSFLRAKTEAFTNFDFLQAKIHAFGIPAVLADFDTFNNEVGDPDEAITAIKQCIRLAKTTLEFRDNENSFAAELLGRMTNMANDHPPLLQPLLNKAKQSLLTKTLDRTVFIPLNQCFMAPNGTMVANLNGHSDGLIDIACTEDRKIMVTASKDQTVRIWDLETDTVVHIIDYHGLPEKLAVCDVQGRAMVMDHHGGLEIFDIKAGNLLYKLEPNKIQNKKHLEHLKVSGNNRSVLKESFNKTGKTNSFAFIFDRILAAGHNNSIYLIDVSAEPKVLKWIQTDAYIRFTRRQDNMLLIGLGVNGILILNPSELSCSIISYKNVAQIVGSAFVNTEQSCLISVVNIDKKASLIFDVISDKSDGGIKKEPVGISDKPALLCDFLKGTAAVAIENQVMVYDIPEHMERNGGKFKTVFTTMLTHPQKFCKKDSVFGNVMNAEIPNLVCNLRLVSIGLEKLLAVGCTDESIRLYDLKSQKIRSIFSGLWGQPTIVTSVGTLLFTGSSTFSNVKVWDMQAKTKNNTQVLIESFEIPPTCWAENGEFILCSVTPDARHIWFSNNEGLHKKLKVAHHHEIDRLICLINKNTLLFADKRGHLHECVLDECLEPNSHKLHSKIVAKLGRTVISWSFSPSEKLIVILLENHHLTKLDLSNYSTSAIDVKASDTNVKHKALQVCLTQVGLILLCKDGAAFLQTLQGNQVSSFDWPAQNCEIFCSKNGYFAALIYCPQTQERKIEIWDLVNATRQSIITAIKDFPVTCMEITNDGRFLLVGMGETQKTGGVPQREVRVYRTEEGSVERKSFFVYSMVSSIKCFKDNYVAVMLELGYMGFFLLKPREHQIKKERPEGIKHKKSVSKELLNGHSPKASQGQTEIEPEENPVKQYRPVSIEIMRHRQSKSNVCGIL